MEAQKKPTKSRKRRSKTSEFVQDFLPVREIRNGIIETTDDRYVKIIEILPINFLLRSSEEQYNIISSFASWLKISPMKLQFKSVSRKADSDKHVHIDMNVQHQAPPLQVCQRVASHASNRLRHKIGLPQI